MPTTPLFSSLNKKYLRRSEGPGYYEEASSWIVLALAGSLQKAGQDPWYDRARLPTHTPHMMETVMTEMERKKVVIICVGDRDLMRCKDKKDFFRFKIHNAIRLESAGKLKVVVLLHGINSSNLADRLADLGVWGKRLKTYFENHYLAFITVNSLDEELKKIISS